MSSKKLVVVKGETIGFRSDTAQNSSFEHMMCKATSWLREAYEPLKRQKTKKQVDKLEFCADGLSGRRVRQCSLCPNTGRPVLWILKPFRRNGFRGHD